MPVGPLVLLQEEPLLEGVTEGQGSGLVGEGGQEVPQASGVREGGGREGGGRRHQLQQGEQQQEAEQEAEEGQTWLLHQHGSFVSVCISMWPLLFRHSVHCATLLPPGQLQWQQWPIFTFHWGMATGQEAGKGLQEYNRQ